MVGPAEAWAVFPADKKMIQFNCKRTVPSNRRNIFLKNLRKVLFHKPNILFDVYNV